MTRYLTLSLDKHLIYQTSDPYLSAVEVFMLAICFEFLTSFYLPVSYQVIFEVKLLTSFRSVSVSTSFNLTTLAHAEGRRKRVRSRRLFQNPQAFFELCFSSLMIRWLGRKKIQRFDVGLGWPWCVNLPKLDLSWCWDLINKSLLIFRVKALKMQ